MAATTGKDHKFADDPSFTIGVVVMDVAPTPIPVQVFSRRVLVIELAPVVSSGTVTPAGRKFIDLGVHSTDADLDLNFEFMRDSTADAMERKFTAGKLVYYTPDGGTTVYTLRFRSGQSFIRVRPAGVHDWQSVQMKFHVVNKS